MTPDDFTRWLALVKSEDASPLTDADVAYMLGVTERTLRNWRAKGADRLTALACAAVWHRLGPFGEGGE